jgi:hypothetical protein
MIRDIERDCILFEIRNGGFNVSSATTTEQAAQQKN